MLFKRNHIWLLAALLFLSSCASYNRQIADYYTYVGNSEFEKASTLLEKNRLLQARRNKLLYLLEKGKMAHLLKNYQQSNTYFNEADLFIEDVRTSAKDIALGTLLNPMMQQYKGEAFEKFMVHYYKSLNYMYLGQIESALVEARRISLRSYTQQDNTRSERKYSDDALALTLQGILYESANDLNNAFIAYRNAAEIFLENNGTYYGTAMPVQLKYDLLRTAYLLGFTGELQHYQQLFGMNYAHEQETGGGELVLFWENGLAPVKREQNIFFSLTRDGAGNFMFIDPTGTINVPFDFSTAVNREQLSAANLRSFRVAFPRYEEQPLFFSDAVVQVEGHQYRFEPVENINTLAFATLKERFLKETSLALSRLAVKKLAEEAARPKDDDKNKNEKEALALALQVFNLASEKADTRNWQTLPHTISYTRIPLKRGSNSLEIHFNGPMNRSTRLEVEGNGTLQLKNLCTLR